jgi:hypothetical protein
MTFFQVVDCVLLRPLRASCQLLILFSWPARAQLEKPPLRQVAKNELLLCERDHTMPHTANLSSIVAVAGVATAVRCCRIA